MVWSARLQSLPAQNESFYYGLSGAPAEPLGAPRRTADGCILRPLARLARRLRLLPLLPYVCGSPHGRSIASLPPQASSTPRRRTSTPHLRRPTRHYSRPSRHCSSRAAFPRHRLHIQRNLSWAHGARAEGIGARTSRWARTGARGGGRARAAARTGARTPPPVCLVALPAPHAPSAASALSHPRRCPCHPLLPLPPSPARARDRSPGRVPASSNTTPATRPRRKFIGRRPSLGAWPRRAASTG